MDTSVSVKRLFANVFDTALFNELESRSILMNVTGGESLLKIGKPFMGVPLMLSGTIKVTRVNEDGGELLIYYITEGATCPMSLTCFMTSQLSALNGYAEEDSSILVVPANVVDDLFIK